MPHTKRRGTAGHLAVDASQSVRFPNLVSGLYIGQTKITFHYRMPPTMKKAVFSRNNHQSDQSDPFFGQERRFCFRFFFFNKFLSSENAFWGARWRFGTPVLSPKVKRALKTIFCSVKMLLGRFAGELEQSWFSGPVECSNPISSRKNIKRPQASSAPTSQTRPEFWPCEKSFWGVCWTIDPMKRNMSHNVSHVRVPKRAKAQFRPKKSLKRVFVRYWAISPRK